MNQTIKYSLITSLFLTTNLIADEKLEDITVTSATKTTQKLKDVTSNMNVITAQEIEERHYTTVTEALNSLPGVSFTSNGGLGKSTSVRLRGFDAKRVLVLIDGIRYNEPVGLNGAQFEHLMITDIEQIEVIKGAQSGIWGADASAGVINIITKKAQKGLHFQASEEFGSFNTTKAHAGASYKTDDYYFKVNHTQTHTNGFTAAAPYGEDINQYEDDGYYNKTTNIQAGFNINASNKIDLSHSIIDARSQFDTKSNPNILENQSSVKNRFSSLNFNHIDSFNEVNLYAKKSSFQRESLSAFNGIVTAFPFDSEIKEYGLNSKIPYAENSFLLVGGDYKEFEYKNAINQSYTNKALFITNSNTISGVLGGTSTITESLRHDQYSTFDNKTTGKIGLKHIHENIKGLTTSINYGTAYNIPTLYNLYDPFSGDLNLIPETTKGYDATIQYKDVSITYFDNKIENLLDFNTATFKYDNLLGTSKIKGYELAYNSTIGEEIATTLSYTKIDTQDNQGFILARRPKESIKFGLDYYGIEDVHLGVNGEYVGDRIEYGFGTHNITANTGNYTIANFVANYDVDDHMSIYGKIDNITDKYYQSIDGYATSPRAIYAGMKLTY